MERKRKDQEVLSKRKEMKNELFLFKRKSGLEERNLQLSGHQAAILSCSFSNSTGVKSVLASAGMDKSIRNSLSNMISLTLSL